MAVIARIIYGKSMYRYAIHHRSLTASPPKQACLGLSFFIAKHSPKDSHMHLKSKGDEHLTNAKYRLTYPAHIGGKF